MDHASFDRIARLFGGSASRRAGLRAALGVALGLLATDFAEAGRDGPAATGTRRRGKPGRRGGDRDRGGGGRRPELEGPCGNGSRKDNACLKDAECCTGLCNTKRANRNVDGKGRCRCIQRARPCAEDRNCCGGRACVKGVCGGEPDPAPPPPYVPVPTGESCDIDGDTCADERASCVVYDQGEPEGTYCLLPFEAACDTSAECVNASCSLGACVGCSCSGCGESVCEPDVCATCDTTTIQAAITAASSGDVIRIAPGTYSEDLTISGKSLTLLGCPGGETVISNATVGVRAIVVSDTSTLELVDIVIEGNNNNLDSYGGGIETIGDLTLCRKTVIRKNRTPDTYGGGIHVKEDASGPVLRVLDGALVSGNRGGNGGGIGIRANATVIVEDYAVIDGNKADSYGGGIYLDPDGRAVIRGHARLTNNVSDSYGGAFAYYGPGSGGGAGGTVLDLGGNAVIHGNTAVYGAGLAFYNSDSYGQENVTIRGNATISDNVASDQGGAIWNDNTRLFISGNAVISGNSAASEGGGIRMRGLGDTYGVQLDISGEVEFSENHCDSYGGAVQIDSVPTRIGGKVKMTGNSAVVAGGAICAGECTLTILDAVQFTGNSSDSYGGAIYTTYNKFTVLGEVAFTGNTGGYGGALALWRVKNDTTAVIGGDVRITGNTARIVGSSPGQGGGLYLDGSHVKLMGRAEVSGNTAEAEGGGFALGVDTIGSSSNKSNLIVSGNAKVTGNTSEAANGGGGVWAENPACVVTAPAGSISGNTPNQCIGSSSADCTA